MQICSAEGHFDPPPVGIGLKTQTQSLFHSDWILLSFEDLSLITIATYFENHTDKEFYQKCTIHISKMYTFNCKYNLIKGIILT